MDSDQVRGQDGMCDIGVFRLVEVPDGGVPNVACEIQEIAMSPVTTYKMSMLILD